MVLCSVCGNYNSVVLVDHILNESFLKAITLKLDMGNARISSKFTFKVIWLSDGSVALIVHDMTSLPWGHQRKEQPYH